MTRKIIKRKKTLIAQDTLSVAPTARHLPQKGQKNKVLIALSGGIDSAVSAYLLIKQGYEVEGAFMKNWSSTKGLIKNECPWLADRQDALRVAAFLGIPLHTLDFEKQYQNKVMKYFFKEYQAGRTPNPDVICNKEIKFKLLYDWAMKNGFDYLATGHYARVKRRGISNFQFPISKQIQNSKSQILKRQDKYALLRSNDEFKDQTYFIYNIKPEQLPHLLFPIGGMKKFAVKKLAEKIGLPNAGRKESMGLCFVGKIRLKEFLDQKIKEKKGKILDQDGNTIGEHLGLHYYTIGQRQGIKVGADGPYYVFKKDLRHNLLCVTNDPDDSRLETKEAQIHSVNWIDKRCQVSGARCQLSGRYRHQGELVPLTVKKIKRDPSRSRRAEADLYQVKFNKPQKAVASGQSLVLYKGRECVGGGVIV